MVVQQIVTGSWFPRTKLHLKEFFAFMQRGTSHLPIDAGELKAAWEKLKPEAVAYNGGRFDFVTARCGEISCTYYEDGLLLLSSPAADPPKSVEALRAFYEGTMAPALALLYSVGTPMISPREEKSSKRPMLIMVRDATDQDAETLATSLGDAVHFTARTVERTVHFADDHLIIAGMQNDLEFDMRLAGEFVFFREYERKLRNFLNLHRTIWESIEEMRAREALTLGELPAMRDRLLDHDRDLSVLRARLGQMDSYLDERQAQIDDLGLAAVMKKLEAYRFAKMRSASKYMGQLWTMLDDYIRSTVEITGLLYQENLQREINFQQFIFLLGSVAALIALGALVASQVTLFSPSGDLLARGSIKAFQLKDLAILGGAAVAATFIIFAVIRPLISSLKRIQTSSLLGGLTTKRVSKPKQ